MKKAYLIAGGSLNLDFLSIELKKLSKEDIIISVDSGLDFLDTLDITPNIVLGDFDSVNTNILDKYLQKNIRIEKHNPIKNYSDTELAINLCEELGYRDILIFGALGKRMDHSLSNLYLCCTYLKKGINISILDEYNKIYAVNKSFYLYKKEQYGKYVSFYPMNGEIKNFSLSGFKYELNNYTINKYLNPSLTLSNELISEEAAIKFDKGLILVVESRDKS